MKRYATYKASGVEWLGDVPEEWEVKRLKHSVRSCRNGIWGNNPEPDSVPIICVRVADFDRAKLRVQLEDPTFRAISEAEREGRLLRPGNLVLEKSGGGEGQPVGTVVIFEDFLQAVCSNFIARLELADEMHPKFWLYAHRSLYNARVNVRSIKQTSGIQNLDQSAYFDEVFPFPVIPEQRAIADFLDREVEKIDALVAEQRRLIALLAEKRQAVINRAVTRGLNPDAPLKPSGIDWLGDIPEDWEVVKLAAVCERMTYGFTNPMPTTEEGPFLLTAADIEAGKINYDNARHTSVDAFRDLLTDKSRPFLGDVLVTKDGTLGRIAVADGTSVCINQSVALLRPMKGLVVPEFIAQILSADTYQARMLFEAGGTTIKHIYISRLAQMPIVLPKIVEQFEIINWISDKQTQLNELINAATIAITLLQERRAALISAAVTGKIDVRDFVPKDISPSLEPA